MRYAFVLMLAFLLLTAPGCLKKNNEADDAQVLRKTFEDFSKALNGRNAEVAVQMMTDKTVYAEAHQPAVSGKEEVKRILQQSFDRFAQFDVEFKSAVDDVQVSGDLGAARGKWSRKSSHKEGVLASSDDKGNWAAICRRQGDGSWKWDSMTVSSDNPLPGTSADVSDEKTLVEMQRNPQAAVSKAQKALGEMKTQYQVSSVDVKDLSVRVLDNVAVSSMQGDMKGTMNGQEMPATMSGIEFFVKRDGKWQTACTQNTITVR